MVLIFVLINSRVLTVIVLLRLSLNVELPNFYAEFIFLPLVLGSMHFYTLGLVYY